jgi:hypothetical protein
MLFDFLAMREGIPSLNIQPVLYTGTGAARTLVTGVNLATGGAVIVRKRTGDSRAVFDTVRGVSQRKRLISPFEAESTVSALTVGDRTLTLLGSTYNVLGDSYAAWLIRKIPGFFTVALANSGVAVSHDLGSVPGAIIALRRTGTETPPFFIDMVMKHRSQFGGVTGWTSSAGPAQSQAGTYAYLLFGHDDERVSCAGYTGDGGDTQDIVLPFAPSCVLVGSASVSAELPSFAHNLVSEDVAGAENIGSVSLVGTTLRVSSNMNVVGEQYIFIALR